MHSLHLDHWWDSQQEMVRAHPTPGYPRENQTGANPKSLCLTPHVSFRKTASSSVSLKLKSGTAQHLQTFQWHRQLKSWLRLAKPPSRLCPNLQWFV